MKNDLIGQRIRQARKHLGLTQEQLASDVFISESYMTLIEQGKRSMSIDILCKIADRLGVSTDYLLTGEDEKYSEKYFRDWIQIINGRSDIEIELALDTLKHFIKCLDKVRGY